MRISKSEWGSGPWQEEPDKLVWVDSATGLDCLVKRGTSGAWCGYVGVPPGHPWYGKDYQSIDADVHGGLSYGDACNREAGICHDPEPGRPEDVWWLGFDCAHLGDFTPVYAALERDMGLEPFNPPSGYKDLNYVKKEVLKLACQAGDAHR